jgi:hypothetical protein
MSGYAQWNPATTYPPDEIVSYTSALWKSLQITTNNQPDVSPTFWSLVGGGGGGGVSGIVAGTGINVSGSSTVTVSNTGVLSVASAGAGITIGGTASAPTVQNTGVLALTAGSGVSITGTPANYTIAATGSGGTLTGVGAGYNISVDNTVPAVPVVRVTADNSTPGGSIAILTDALTSTNYYGLSSFSPSFLTLDPANNGAPSNQFRGAGIQDINVLANPQTGGTDLQFDVLFSERTTFGKAFFLTLGLPVSVYNNNNTGNNNMTVRAIYEDASGTQTVVGNVSISPQKFVIWKAINPRSGNTNGTPYTFVYERFNSGGVDGGVF